MFKFSGKHSTVETHVPAEPFSERLQVVSAELVQLNQGTEQDFLTIGARLQGFTLVSRELNRISGTVLELTSGTELQASINGLGELLSELEAHLQGLEQQFEQSFATLKRYQEIVARVNSSARDFRQTILNLNMLGFLTRVENSHLFKMDSGFASLADDVGKLAGNIRLRSQEILDQAQRLFVTIEAFSGRVFERETRRRQQARQLMETTLASHRALVQRQNQAVNVAHSLDGQAAAIAARIAQIVAGLQFNEINRQPLAHVVQALDGLREALNRPGGEASLIDKAGATLEIAGLQLKQVEHARCELTTAVADVVLNLKALVGVTTDMLSRLKLVSWSADAVGRDFMSEISAGMDSIIAGLAESNRGQAELAEAMQEVSRMVAEMAGFVADIERLGVELQLVALNARIKAARIGTEGLTLDTISGAIYELSTNSREDTRRLAEMLHGLVNLAQDFNRRFADDKQFNQDLGLRLGERFDAEHLTLKTLNAQVGEHLAIMNQTGAQLAEDINAVCGSITVHEVVAEVLAEQAARLAELIAEAERVCVGADLSQRPQYLEQLSHHYTMDSERRIHSTHVGGQSEAGLGGPPADGGGLGGGGGLFFEGR